MDNLQTLLTKAATLHSPLCPRQVLGIRMGLLAGKLLELELPHPDKRLFTFVETDGCGADGISVATGCSIGHRNMRVMDFGKMAATFVDVITLEAVRIVPHQDSRTRAKLYAPDITDRWEAQLRAYQTIPDDELFSYKPVRLQVSLEAIISRHGLRVNCEMCGEEIMNEREVLVNGSVLCRSCAGQAYYTTDVEERVALPFSQPLSELMPV